ncbi:MAG: peptidylprolyl isomerase [Bacteroidetes bacterium]|nr:peptidylprolyl isomerase [Bacteroidota bacterium]HET6245546.1 peptidylprolyl isomerase [Bacteroidia bacterium]
MKNLILLISVLFIACDDSPAQKKGKTPTEPIVLISTEFGDIKVKLYNETPLHRDNFIKLASEKQYDASIFHRVIPGFMVQGGGVQGGTKDIGGTIPAEINQKFVHKRGALCAARMGDNVNPLKASSGSQFYIVHGKSFTKEEILSIGNRAGFPYNEEQINAYLKLGGAPHLDGGYTVFGEVIEGMDVIDKIAVVERNPQDKPLKDVKMTMKVLKK